MTEHPEDRCDKCGGPNISWFTDSELWNRVAGNRGILCPICFCKMAEAMGIRPTTWQLLNAEATLAEAEVADLADICRRVSGEAGNAYDDAPSEYKAVLLAASDTLAEAAGKIKRLEQQLDDMREASCCPPDCGLEKWLQILASMLHEANEQRCKARQFRLERDVLALNRMRKDNPVIVVIDWAGEVVAVTWPDAETITAAGDPVRLPAYARLEATT